MSIGPWRPESEGPRRPLRLAVPLPWRGSRGGHGDPTLESPALRRRINVRLRSAEALVVVLVAGLLFGFWRLQVVRAAHYRELAENNRSHDVLVRAPRGLITDRQGRLLAANRAAFNVAVIREDVGDLDGTLEWLGTVLDQPVAELRDRLARRRDTPAFRPVVIAEDVEPAVVASVEARRREYPGVLVHPENRRYYPEGDIAAHILGQVGEITREQLDGWGRDRFRLGDIVGQNGLERRYNMQLAGNAGERQVIVNSAGRIVRLHNEIAPHPGDTLTLTLDLELQRAAEAELDGRKGAIVVLDVRTGGVLALASSPVFDPNLFAGRFSRSEWLALVEDPAKPFQNRALQSSYPPGSIFKLAMAVAGLESGVITPETTVYCTGSAVYYGSRRRCWYAGGHGTVNLRRALGHSCNIYFYELGQKLGRERIVEIAQRFGFGSVTGIDLPGERQGILPTDGWLETQGRRWFPGETISLAIGQGAMDATPIQLARLVAIVGSGRDVRPYLVERRQDAAAATSEELGRTPEPLGFDPRHLALVREGMYVVVNERGTGWRAGHPDVTVGGKTGSAQVASAAAAGPVEGRPEELRNHAWFVGLAPLEAPQIAVSVFLEHGGSGGQDAAPVGGRIFAAWHRIVQEEGVRLTGDGDATAGEGGS